MTPEGKFTIVFSNSIQAKKWGGGEKWMITAARGLADRGHQVIMAGKKGAVFIHRAQEANLQTVLFNVRADFHPLKMMQIQKFLQSQRVDIILLNLNKDIRVAGWAASRARVPVILARNGLKLISDKLEHRITISLVDGIITNTYSIKEEYKEIPWLPESKVKVIYNGIAIPSEVETIDLHRQYDIPDDHLILAAVGRLSPQKGFDLLVSAMAQVKATGLPGTVLIVGKGKLRNRLEQLAHTLGAQDRVRLVGFIKDPLPLIKSADYVILTSLQEGLPNVVMEAMALGTPVLSTHVNGVPELLQHMESGYLFEPGSVEAIVGAIKFAYDNRHTELPRRFGEAARKVIHSKFSLAGMIDHLEEYFVEKYAQSHRR